MTQPRRLLRLVALLAAFSLVAAACGGDDGDDVTGGTGGTGDGQALEQVPGFDGETITLGVLTPTTGPVAVIGNPLTNGNRVFFEALNARGGIAGKYPVELAIEDTQYSEDLAAQKYDALRNRVVMFAQILGTPVVNALLQNLEDDNLVAQPASLDSFWVREQQLLPLGAPYQIQAINAMSWWIEEEGNTDSTICWAGHDDPYGEAGLEGMEFAADQLGFEIAETVRFSSTASSADVQTPNAQALAQAGCEVVFVTATPTTTGALLNAAARAQYAPQWIGQSPTWVNALATSQLAPYLAQNLIVVGEGTPWGDRSVRGMAQMLDDLEATGIQQDPDPYFVFGYAEAWAVSQVLERAVELGDLSREGIVEAMNSLGEVGLEGLIGSYQEWGPPEERVPPKGSRLYRIDPDAPETGYWVPATDVIESEAAQAFEFEG